MRTIIITLTAVFAASLLHACNTCGCAASNQYPGMLSQITGSFIGLQYSYRWYESHHDASEAGKPPGQEYYQSAQLWGRLAIGRRLQLLAFLPYQYNTKQEDGARTMMSGVGDASVLANVRVVSARDSFKSWRHSLLAGGGIKAPTGVYNKMALGSGDLLSPSMQAGTGSWDFVGNINYTVQHGPIGLNAEASYVVTTPNFQDYKYGNRLSAGVQAFRTWERKGWRFLPCVGARYEESAQDYDNFSTRSLAVYTGGYMIYGNATFRAYCRHWGAELSYFVPVSQHYGGDLVASKGKAEAGFMYLF